MPIMERPSNTDEQVHDYVTKALNLVAELDPDRDLAPHVFQAAVNLYAAKALMEASQVSNIMLGNGFGR